MEANLRSFLQTHESQIHKPKKCGVCQKTMSSQIELREHKRVEHELHISFRCPICDRAFSGELNLHRHIQTHTYPMSPLSCNFCGQIETNSHDLETHVLQHNNRLECTVCGKVLKHKSNLVLHMRIHVSVGIEFHTEEYIKINNVYVCFCSFVDRREIFPLRQMW